jgi:predicted phosphoribosyltransferase
MATARPQLRIFSDRRDAGRVLAPLVRRLELRDPVVIGLPRGGVPVAYEVASALGAPLGLVVARKVAAPDHPEFAIGAVAEGGICVVDHANVHALRLGPEELEQAIGRARAQVDALAERYRAAAPALPLTGRSVVVVDDGLATGATARAAVQAIWARGARSVVLAVPVASHAALELLEPEVDHLLCAEAPYGLWAVGFWYQRFEPTPDEEVVELLRSGRAREAVELA